MLKSLFKTLLLILWIGVCYLPVLTTFKLRKFVIRDRIVQFCNAGILRIIGIKITVTGQLADARPLLLVSNHVSYLDIFILNSQMRLRFTAKHDIAGWPIIGHIARICSEIFIDRRPEKIVEMRSLMQSALAAHHVVSLFPESTTGNGLHMQPFKSGFFSIAEEAVDGHALIVQPAAITYTQIRRLPIDMAQWPNVAWYGDMELVPHLWNLLRLGPISAELVFLPPVTIEQFGDRKKLAAHCHRIINENIQSIRSKPIETGRPRSKFHPRFLRLKS